MNVSPGICIEETCLGSLQDEYFIALSILNGKYSESGGLAEFPASVQLMKEEKWRHLNWIYVVEGEIL